MDYTPTLADSATPPVLTILFDLSRMLRFYDGGNTIAHGGVAPLDPGNYSYFFCHSAFPFSVASFLGPIGSIQGYATVFNYIDSIHGNELRGVKGWMTAIYSPDKHILSAMLNGDDDNDFTIAKGSITTSSGTGPYSFHYNISEVDVSNFTPVSTLGDSTTITWIQPGGSPVLSGEAQFTLGFVAN